MATEIDPPDRQDTLERLAIVAEFRDDNTGQHTARVGEIAAKIAGRLGWSALQVDQLRLAARLHDIGKIALPDEILRKPGKLSEQEWALMREHPKTGAQMLEGNKQGIERYGFCLPMDDALAQVAIDFGGRPWLVWEAEFKREKIGEMPTEMFFHFFKSFADAARCNLSIKAKGINEHHKIEAIFKAFAKAIRMAVKNDGTGYLPTTKGII